MRLKDWIVPNSLFLICFVGCAVSTESINHDEELIPLDPEKPMDDCEEDVEEAEDDSVPNDFIHIPYCPNNQNLAVQCNQAVSIGDGLSPQNPRAGQCCQRKSNEDSMNPSFRINQLQITKPNFLGIYNSYLTQFIGVKESSNLLATIDFENSSILLGGGTRNAFKNTKEVTYSYYKERLPSERFELDYALWHPAMMEATIKDTDSGTLVSSNYQIVNLAIPFFETRADVFSFSPVVELPFYSLRITRALLTDNRSCVGRAVSHRNNVTQFCATDESSDGILEGFIRVSDVMDKTFNLSGVHLPLCQVLNYLHPCEEDDSRLWSANAVCTEEGCNKISDDENHPQALNCTLEGPNRCAWHVRATFSAAAVPIVP